MLVFFDFARDLSLLAIATRLLFAFLLGSLIGFERELKRRPAGLRTHILIYLGASITTLTGQYFLTGLGYYTDPSRLGAQVIAGIGFLGAGTIVVTKNKSVRGLTTAAGLWCSAIVGLVCGAGYLELAIVATLLILFAELVLVKLERLIIKANTVPSFYIEYNDPKILEEIVRRFAENGLEIVAMDSAKSSGAEAENRCQAFLTVSLLKHQDKKTVYSIFDSFDELKYTAEL